MTIDSYSLTEHFDFMKNCIPQPFFITSEEIKELVEENDEYYIKTNSKSYILAKAALKKLVDALGIKLKLLSTVCSESNVIELAMPIINKLLKCYADCFVFYANSDDALTIIDLNVNNEKGEEGTKYENGPSPWPEEAKKDLANFTCFTGFNTTLEIDDNSNIMVVAEDIMQSANSVSFNLFKASVGSVLQPMLEFSSKFSNLEGFTCIHPAMYDDETGITISFPTNYYSKNSPQSFNDLWKKVESVQAHTDINDYIFNEIAELKISADTPSSVVKFIEELSNNSIINLNQPIKNILIDANSVSSGMKQSKKIRFKKQIGSLIGWCVIMKHSGCSSCGHMSV